ncbi:hypothetical protein JQ612_08380 [Bradyrhizobium manausense]|uniref:hypothetical protein n=1 Tax=Bradyrhizobium manausense TaxID=989370 RepID=UPI001BA7871A|nr:hypothetical protein [Bradyrhizobium manausense]MBR0833208.1 hypothetical protein [Bradyrhizobium manausense]
MPKAEIDPLEVDMSTHQGREIELISRLFQPGNNDCSCLSVRAGGAVFLFESLSRHSMAAILLESMFAARLSPDTQSSMLFSIASSIESRLGRGRRIQI